MNSIENDAWIMTFSGLRFSLNNPKPEQVSLIDIAHHLSQICRCTGATKFFYSVAHHCLLGVKKMIDDGMPSRLVLLFAIHDASEAYYTDINKPLKNLLGDGYEKLEEKGMLVILDALGIPYPTDEEWRVIKKYDDYMFQNEIASLMHSPDEFPMEPLYEIQIESETIQDVKKAYIYTVKYLMASVESENKRKVGA